MQQIYPNVLKYIRIYIEDTRTGTGASGAGSDMRPRRGLLFRARLVYLVHLYEFKYICGVCLVYVH